MKQYLGIFAAFVFLLQACSSGGSGSGLSDSQILGKWQITGVAVGESSMFHKNNKDIGSDECVLKTVWEFTSEEAKALSDGTKTKKMMIVAPEECQHYSTDSTWTIYNGRVFLTSSRIGGVGGISLAGQFKVNKVTATELELFLSDVTISFKKI